jgi:hypothetical protein
MTVFEDYVLAMAFRRKLDAGESFSDEELALHASLCDRYCDRPDIESLDEGFPEEWLAE